MYRGGSGLERHAFLDRLQKRLADRGCAVGWNPDSQPWDVRARRGALGEAYLKLVVEHHGGSRRLARLSAVIRPSPALWWAQAAAASAVVATTAGGSLAAAVFSAMCFAGLWIGPVAEAARLEAAITAACDEVSRELDAGGAGVQFQEAGD